MIKKQSATIYYAATAKRRYFTKKAAIEAEAKAIIKQRYPTEQTERDDDGRVTHPGWHWRELKNSDKLFRRMCLLIKRE